MMTRTKHPSISFSTACYLCTVLLLNVFNLSAQSSDKAVALLKQASDAYVKAGGINATFTLQLLQPGGTKGELLKGTIKLKGKKFKLEVDDMITWFDGSNQWVYLKQNQEVNVSNPTEEELLMVNPINVFQLYRHGYASHYQGLKTHNGKQAHSITLTPQDKYSSLKSIEALFDKDHLRPLHISILNKDQSGTLINIPTYQTGQSYPDNLFIYPARDYPSNQVIDLRL